MIRKYPIILILLLAATLRLWGLERGDTINDEVFYAFRAIGLLDFDAAEEQITPLEWHDPSPFADCAALLEASPADRDQLLEKLPQHCREERALKNLSAKGEGVPWWTYLSFHDHPPFVFWVQHLFIKVLGENPISFRLPSALLGVASVYLLYLVGYELFTKRVALISAAILAVTLNHVFISRTGMQESYVIFFILLPLLFFLKALRNDKFFIWLGISLGLGFLAKITVFILAPILTVYVLLFKREHLLNKRLWVGVGLAILLFSPVIIYNLKLYQDVGHFDFQFSYISGQRPEIWKVAPGKEVGSLSERLGNFSPRMLASNSWVFLGLFLGFLLVFLRGLVGNAVKTFHKYALLIFCLVFIFLLLMLIGPSFRFLAMSTPFLALGVALFLDVVYEKFLLGRRWLAYTALGLFLLFEVFYSVNNQILYYPYGPSPWFFAKVRYDNYNWGYNELEKFLNQEFKGKMPAYTFDLQYKFLEKMQSRALALARKKGFQPDPFLITYGGNIDDGAKLWILERRLVYQGWPMLKLDDYFDFRKKYGEDYFLRSGFKNFYFILASNTVFPPEVKKTVEGMIFTVLRNQKGDEIFRIYQARY